MNRQHSVHIGVQVKKSLTGFKRVMWFVGYDIDYQILYNIETYLNNKYEPTDLVLHIHPVFATSSIDLAVLPNSLDREMFADIPEIYQKVYNQKYRNYRSTILSTTQKHPDMGTVIPLSVFNQTLYLLTNPISKDAPNLLTLAFTYKSQTTIKVMKNVHKKYKNPEHIPEWLLSIFMKQIVALRQ